MARAPTRERLPALRFSSIRNACEKESIRATNGVETGMKWLRDKSEPA